MGNIQYPYIPIGHSIFYVSSDNHFVVEAKEYAKQYSLDKEMPTASVIVRGDMVIGRGTNGSDYHLTHECERVKRGILTGQKYELCEGCHPKNHSEPRAIADAVVHGHITDNADLYLWGHWWICEQCWNTIIMAGIRNVYLMEGSENLFNKNHPRNIIGGQFL